MRHPVSRLRTRALAVGLALAASALVPSGSAGAADQYQWAALGDSYTAGGFVGEPLPALGDESRDGCDRTSDAYPGVVARELEEFPPGKYVRLTNVSCGNATIADIAETRQTPVSPVQPPAEGWSAVDTQIKRAKLSEETDVVTIGVGGNSLPFGGMLLKCLQLGAIPGKTCQEYYTNPPEGEEGIQDKLARVQDEYVEMLAKVHEAAPNAKVITVGYPAVLPAEGSTCNRPALTELGSIKHADVDWLRENALIPLNKTIQQVTQFFGDRYVDVYSSSVGHDACQPAEEKWVEGICGDAADYWPASLPGTILNCGLINKRATLVHPNAQGHANTAAHVERAIRISLLER
ncbi:lipase [Streptomyces cinereoruber]|uniref:Lipase n=1 Tax=Streptomyces cinereoruber TaxID=67260 RepID=A0AAV4KGB4_9ACTN|nr:SGNH/GDSL hydrolase family protein [Streptomyces cinereoruber]MBB4162438.1 lysophospholipase L1-like esterase [Streptomyces cinereoruber]MBY8820528.1 SGNH/GDSL hydrolase family protein [Streptomyces cinereoruber]NIH63971.1 lysophospholipase L1-like esterase [Streptomyces cinereoruber]QEV36525.1 SGNH/GDSL hydrolase family protein [Streptomyces cinereoruber]GGR20690.1 lipase [Streptomyces cinereoruber]